MEFSITDLMSERASVEWITQHFHPQGLSCPHCGKGVAESYVFRQTRRSGLTVYRCKGCWHIYNLYSGTVFERSHLRPSQVVLLLRGVLKGESSQQLAREIGVSYKTVLGLRHTLHTQAERLQPETPLPDQVHENDEMFQNAGEKRRGTLRPA